jgi:hypothetical protein
MKTSVPSWIRIALLLAVGTLALAASAPSASAQNISWSDAENGPSIPVNKIPGFFIWHVKNEVYLTTANDKKKGDQFAGTITVTGGTISGLVGSQLEKNDHLQLLNSTTVQFVFHTYTGHDNLHFKLSGGTLLSFYLTKDEVAAPGIIYYGKKKTAYKGSDPINFNLDK